MTDLDKGGRIFPKVRVYRGASLGWCEIEVNPTDTVSVSGTYNPPLGVHTVLVNTTGVTVQLPDINVWVNSVQFYPGMTYENSIWVKDASGQATSSTPITIAPFGSQQIDGLSQNFKIIQARAIIRLYPRKALSTGWGVE